MLSQTLRGHRLTRAQDVAATRYCTLLSGGRVFRLTRLCVSNGIPRWSPGTVQDKPDIRFLAERILKLSAGTFGVKCRACGASLNGEEDLARHGSQHVKVSQLRLMASSPYWRCGHTKVQREIRGRRIIYRCLRCFQIAPSYYYKFCPLP